MLYRQAGCSGLRTSVFSLGNASMGMIPEDEAVAIVRRALDAGITHFDTAESYGGGAAEGQLAAILAKLGVAREKVILSTKAFTFGWSDPHAAPHEVRSLSRKYLLHAIERSLQRLGTDHVDIYYCHQRDPDTPVGEVVDTMDGIVRAGKARYWAVSNWDGRVLARACEHAERHGRQPPILNQIELSLLHRRPVEATSEAMARHGTGVVGWGALAGGVLSGKYLSGASAGSRAEAMATAVPSVSRKLLDAERNRITGELAGVAAEIGCTVGQLALAWCLARPEVATVILSASRVAQLEDNLGALPVIDRLTPAVMEAIAAIVGGHDLSSVPVDLSEG